MFRTALHSRRAPNAVTALRWLVYGLFLVCGVAQSAIVPLLPRLSAAYGLSPSESALLLALPGIATLAVSVPAGLAADRYGARRVTLAAGTLLALSCVAHAGHTLTLLLAGRIVFGIAFGVVWTTGVAWLADLDDGPGGPRLGPSVTCSSVGVMLGPAVGGVLGQVAGTGVPFLLIAAATVAVLVPLTVGSARRDPAERATARAREAVAAVAAGPAVRGTALRTAAAVVRRPGFGAAAGGLMVAGAVSSASQLLITGGLHADGISTGRIGLAFSAAAVAYIFVSVTILRAGTRAHTLRFNAMATAILALALLPALAGGGTGSLVAALVLCSVPRAAVSTIAYSLPARAAGGDGLQVGMLNGAWAGAMVLTPIVAGAVEQHGGAQVAYLSVIVPCALVAALLLAGGRTRTVATWLQATGWHRAASPGADRAALGRAASVSWR